MADSAKIISGIIGGDIDCCMLAGFGQVLPAVEKGAKLKIVGGCIFKGATAVYAKDPAITSVRDLEGKTVAVGALGSLLHLLMVGLMRKKGADPGKVRFGNQ